MIETAEPVENEAPKATRRERIVADLAFLRSAALSVFAILAIFAIVVVTVRDLTRAPVVLEEIVVPESFSKDGYTGLVVSNMLWDEIEAIRNFTGTRDKTVRIQTASRQLDVVEPGSGLSLQRVTQVLRSLLNFPQTRIAGEFVCPTRGCTPDQLVLTLRIFSGEGTRVIPSQSIGKRTMQDFMHETALRLMEQEIDPLVAAWYYYYTGPEDWELITTALATRTMVERGAKSEEAVALLGYVDLYNNRTEKALLHSEDAMALGDEVRQARSFAQRIGGFFSGDGGDAIRADSYYLRGTALMAAGRQDEAIANFEQAADLAPGVAAIRSGHARALFGTEGQEQKVADLFEMAARIDPGDPYIWIDWSFALDALGEAELADEKIAIAASIAFDDLWIQYFAGNISLDEAIIQARSWVEATPENPGAWRFWSQMLAEKSAIDYGAICDQNVGQLAEYLYAAQQLAPPDIQTEAHQIAKDRCGWSP